MHHVGRELVVDIAGCLRAAAIVGSSAFFCAIVHARQHARNHTFRNLIRHLVVSRHRKVRTAWWLLPCIRKYLEASLLLIMFSLLPLLPVIHDERMVGGGHGAERRYVPGLPACAQRLHCGTCAPLPAPHLYGRPDRWFIMPRLPKAGTEDDGRIGGTRDAPIYFF